ncbi:hypothetical protein HPB50_008738 [Hyalomma asiaticum]|uniref:Uncharacterized protein n=1 Tax=Hyalomma asiaticum TaxID=266040 RepID=A0ACB7SD94_HYAAI|nr:hypothetical protein HPB50_008738 [Hyalomma asiaticum]
MFPVMRVVVSGMDPKVYYMVLMDLTPMDNFRYRFLGNCWLPVEPATEILPGEGGSLYVHENGPCVGSKWMMAPVDFGTVKLTNQKSATPQQIMLQSMRKYVPRIHIFAGSDVQQLDYRRFKTFVFPETAFITVTSYQNDQIITLKIQNNPYARSFFSNADRRNSRRLAEEESASVEDGTGRDSAAKTFPAPSTSCTGTATTAEQHFPSIASSLSSGYAANAVPSLQHAWAQRTTSQHLFAPHGPTDLGWYSPLYGLAQELQYATTPAVMGQSYRPYVPSPYMNVATAPEFSPFYLRSLLDSSRSASSPVVTPSAAPVSSATVSSPLSASSAMSRPCATPATPASSLEALSTAALVSAPLTLFRNVTTSSHTQNHSFSPS